MAWVVSRDHPLANAREVTLERLAEFPHAAITGGPRELRDPQADRRALVPARCGLSEREIDRLRALAPRLKALCQEVAAGPVPPSLAHGDLHRSNIMAAGQDVRLFDPFDPALLAEARQRAQLEHA